MSQSTADSPRPLGPHQLLSDIREFSESIADYLLPVIRYVGARDHVHDSLRRQFAGLIHETAYSGLPANVVVFADSRLDDLPDPQALPPDTAYVFCSPFPRKLGIEQVVSLRRLVGITLINPSPKSLAWHIRALLFLSDISYANERELFPAMLSVDPAFRQCLSSLADAAAGLRSSVFVCADKGFREDMDRYLIGTVPGVFIPSRTDADTLRIEALPEDRSSLVSLSVAPESSLAQLLPALLPLLDARPVVAIIDSTEALEAVSDSDARIHLVPSLASRYPDALLIAYWCSAFKSHDSERTLFYSEAQIEQSLIRTDHESCSFIVDLLNEVPEDYRVGEKSVELIESLDRLSIDDVFDAAERYVMQILKDRSDLVDAATVAAGIPKVTFHKRMRRLVEKQGLLSILDETVKES